MRERIWGRKGKHVGVYEGKDLRQGRGNKGQGEEWSSVCKRVGGGDGGGVGNVVWKWVGFGSETGFSVGRESF